MHLPLKHIPFSLVVTGFASSALISSALAVPQSLGEGSLPIRVTPSQEDFMKEGEQIVISGIVNGSQPATIILRVDDDQSSDYASRYNLEQKLLPGPFDLRLPASGLRTTSGRLLDTSALYKVVLDTDSPGLVQIDKFAIEEAPQLPKGSVGYSFGLESAPLFPGFKRVTKDSDMIKGGQPIPVLRKGPDDLVVSGMKGVERVTLPWPQGEPVTVHLWIEDLGDWEALPYPLERRININHETVHLLRETIDEWVARRYLAGKRREVQGAGDAWEDIAKHRGGYIRAETVAGENGVTIDLAGDSLDATHLSAVLLTPPDDEAAIDFVNSERAHMARAGWPVSQNLKTRQADASFPLSSEGVTSTPLNSVVASGSGQWLTVALTTNEPAVLDYAQLEFESDGFSGYVWAALRTLERTATNSNLLEVQQSRLLSDINGLSVEPQTPRLMDLWVDVATSVKPGIYGASLQVIHSQGQTSVPITIEVPQVRLPKAAYPAGFYMDVAPHLKWAFQEASKRTAQVQCDLDFMAQMGLTALAPPLETPAWGLAPIFYEDLTAATDLSAQKPHKTLAYTPLKRLQREMGDVAAAQFLADFIPLIKDRKLPVPYWSVADEPSNPQHGGKDNTAQWIATLRQHAPEAKLAAQFNTPEDLDLADQLDLVLINDGFELTAETVSAIKEEGPLVWLYNTGRIRETAAFGMNITGATAYVQWHSRIPTADPFDPTDGREGDVQMLLPTAKVCQNQPDIHIGLLEMASGLVDQRWYQFYSVKEDSNEQNLKINLWKIAEEIWINGSDSIKITPKSLRQDIVQDSIN
ncbi:hypothetical protein E1162_16765 [Rhodobacteraceae bacterium RKSG542]|uniref:hypothetical protein n=1 Tax=Pseudovibrio flavus TaxID=2529854 RepID=UPI0012BCF869|nr:hypothetical protein [Pseudovibrio flavus]MTI18897.1 hypothetical protein [Pseudovibrio flavus]